MNGTGSMGTLKSANRRHDAVCKRGGDHLRLRARKQSVLELARTAHCYKLWVEK